MTAQKLVLVVMGVSGSGKSTLAEGLRDRLHWPFQEGDALHPAANVAKMRAGLALTDEDRAPWLAAVKAWIDAHLAAGEHGLITCSALKRVYRDRLVAGRPSVRLLYLRAESAVLRRRLEHRHGHFMPASLLESQLDTLEEPGSDENPMIVQMDGSPQENLEAAILAVTVAQRAGEGFCGPGEIHSSWELPG